MAIERLANLFLLGDCANMANIVYLYHSLIGHQDFKKSNSLSMLLFLKCKKGILCIWFLYVYQKKNEAKLTNDEVIELFFIYLQISADYFSLQKPNGLCKILR